MRHIGYGFAVGGLVSLMLHPLVAIALLSFYCLVVALPRGTPRPHANPRRLVGHLHPSPVTWDSYNKCCPPTMVLHSMGWPHLCGTFLRRLSCNVFVHLVVSFYCLKTACPEQLPDDFLSFPHLAAANLLQPGSVIKNVTSTMVLH